MASMSSENGLVRWPSFDKAPSRGFSSSISKISILAVLIIGMTPINCTAKCATSQPQCLQQQTQASSTNQSKELQGTYRIGSICRWGCATRNSCWRDGWCVAPGTFSLFLSAQILPHNK
jgi:hypothetical protein